MLGSSHPTGPIDSMKYFTTDGSGIDSLKLVEGNEIPEPGPQDATIEIYSVSLNYRDLMVSEGSYGAPPPKPIIPCSDMAGVVRSVGSNVRNIAIGDRVISTALAHWPAGRLRREFARTFLGGGSVNGVLAERVNLPAASLVRAPANLSMIEASTLPIAGLTAWAALVPFGKLRPGEWVLTHGTGGVSVFVMQLARAMGARVLCTTSSEEKATLVKARYGVTETFDWRDQAWADRVMEYTGQRGVDVVVETAGGAQFARSLEAAGYGARIAVIGVLDGGDAPVNLLRILTRTQIIGGIYMESTEELESFCRAVRTMDLHPCVDKVFPFEAAKAAYKYLKDRKHTGKVVIELKADARMGMM